MKAVLGGLIGGAVGAALWAGIVAVTGYEIGWIAWIAGALVGFGVAKGNQEGAHSSTAAGALAVVIAALSIVVGKYAGTQLAMPDEAEIRAMITGLYEDEEYVVSFVADGVASDFELQGRTVAWPEGVEPGNASSAADYPPDVWAEAEMRWTAMTEAERVAFREAREAETMDNMTMIQASMATGGFLGSFTPMDVIFFGLAMATAFGVGSGAHKTKQQIAEEYGEAIQLAMIKVMIADGDVDEGELRVISDTYKRVTGQDLSHDVIRAKATLARAQGRDLVAALVDLAPHLSDEGKMGVLRAAVMVAVADGTFETSEKALIDEIAGALGMSEDQIREAVTALTKAA